MADFQYHSDLFATLILTSSKFKCFLLAYYFWSHLYMKTRASSDVHQIE